MTAEIPVKGCMKDTNLIIGEIFDIQSLTINAF